MNRTEYQRGDRYVESWFGELRSLLQEAPSPLLWERLSEELTVRMSADQVGETELEYCAEILGRWPEEIERPPHDRWVERWRGGEWSELAGLCHTKLGSFYLYGRSAGSGSNEWVRALWSRELSTLLDDIEELCSMVSRAPGDLDLDVDVLWQNGHRLAVFWCGREVQSVDLNRHVIWEKFFDARNVRSSEDAAFLHEVWEGVDAGGDPIELAYDELLDRVFDAGPGDVMLRVDVPSHLIRPLVGTQQEAPIDVETHRVELERALGYTFLGPTSWAEGEVETSWI